MVIRSGEFIFPDSHTSDLYSPVFRATAFLVTSEGLYLRELDVDF